MSQIYNMDTSLHIPATWLVHTSSTSHLDDLNNAIISL